MLTLTRTLEVAQQFELILLAAQNFDYSAFVRLLSFFAF